MMKVSRRDLPFALATSQTGATTVAATMICADLAGIRKTGGRSLATNIALVKNNARVGAQIALHFVDKIPAR